MTNGTLLGTACAVAALAMFSSNIVLTKVAIGKLNLNLGFLVAVAVNVLFGAVAFGLELALRRDALRWDGSAFAMFLLSGAFTTWLGRWFFFEAIARLGPSKASTFQVSSPVFTALVAWGFLGERLSPKGFVAMAGAVFGLYLVSVPRGAPGLRAPAGTQSGFGARARDAAGAVLRSGILLGLGSSLAYAVGNVLRGAATHRWEEPILGALLGALSGIALHMAFNRSSRTLPATLRSADRTGLLLYAVSGILTMSAQMLTIASMSYIPVSIAALITLCTPLLVFPLSYLLFRNEERITPRVLVGSALALGGIAAIISK